MAESVFKHDLHKIVLSTVTHIFRYRYGSAVSILRRHGGVGRIRHIGKVSLSIDLEVYAILLESAKVEVDEPVALRVGDGIYLYTGANRLSCRYYPIRRNFEAIVHGYISYGLVCLVRINGNKASKVETLIYGQTIRIVIRLIAVIAYGRIALDVLREPVLCEFRIQLAKVGHRAGLDGKVVV